MPGYMRGEHACCRLPVFAKRPWILDLLGHRMVYSSVPAARCRGFGNEIVPGLPGYNYWEGKKITNSLFLFFP